VPGIKNELGKLPEPGAVCAWDRGNQAAGAHKLFEFSLKKGPE
jgi:hypothetical protein